MRTGSGYEDRYKVQDYGQFDYYQRQNYYDDMPTIQDEEMDTAGEVELVTLHEESLRQNGILHDVNNIERMVLLGQMAISASENLRKMLALPSFLEQRCVV